MSNRCSWIAHAFSSIQHSYAVPVSHCRDEESCGRWSTSEGDGVCGTCGTADDFTARAVSTETRRAEDVSISFSGIYIPCMLIVQGSLALLPAIVYVLCCCDW